MICRFCKKDIASGETMCPECYSDLRNWFAKHKVISSILVFIILATLWTALETEEDYVLENDVPVDSDF